MTRIFLHLGAQKTGTKSIQKSLYQSRERLAAAGIAYLGGPTTYEGISSAFSPAPETMIVNIRRGLTAAEIEREREETLDRLTREIREAGEAGCDRIIISAENLFRLPAHKMTELRDFFTPFGEVYAVYYYRAALDWIASYSQQLARSGGTEPADLSDALVPIAVAPRRIMQVFGLERSRIRSFDSAVRTGLCRSFLEACSAPGDPWVEVEEVRANVGMSEHATRVLFAYNRFLKKSKRKRDPEVVKAITAVPGPKFKLSCLSPEEHEEYARLYYEVTNELGLDLDPPEKIPVGEESGKEGIPEAALVALFGLLKQKVSQ